MYLLCNHHYDDDHDDSDFDDSDFDDDDHEDGNFNYNDDDFDDDDNDDSDFDDDDPSCELLPLAICQPGPVSESSQPSENLQHLQYLHENLQYLHKY